MKLKLLPPVLVKRGSRSLFSTVYVALLMLTLNPLRLIRFYLVIGPMMKLNLYYNMLKNGLLFGGLLNICRSKVMPFMGLPLMNGRNN